jgi:hypothetical protein
MVDLRGNNSVGPVKPVMNKHEQLRDFVYTHAALAYHAEFAAISIEGYIFG